MAKRTEIIHENKEGEFLGIKAPALELFKVVLQQRSQSIKQVKTGEITSQVNDYTLSINRTAISKSYHEELANNLKQMFGMNWAPFNWTTQTFNYYTSKYTGDDEFKKNQLTQIFEYLADFEKDYKLKRKQSYSEFHEDKENFENYKDEELVVKYHPELDAVIVLAISFLGTEKYKILAGASKEKGKLGHSSLQESFFDDIYVSKTRSNKMYFIINPYDYQNVKTLIEKKKEEKELFLEKQNEAIEAHKHEFIDYNDKNMFDFKIKFHEDRKCFEFYCKGFHDPTRDFWGRSNPRSILARWALNFIISEELSHDDFIEKREAAQYSDSDEIDLENHYKPTLDIQKDSSSREKQLWVPAEQWQKLQRMLERFKKENEFFQRAEKTLKISDINLLSRSANGVNLSRYPSIYFDKSGKGKAYLIYQYRNVEGRTSYEEDKVTIKKQSSPYLGMKGIELTMKEIDMFLNTHPLSQQIRNNTVYMNSEVWMNNGSQNTALTQEEREHAFENIYMHVKLENETKQASTTRKMKI